MSGSAFVLAFVLFSFLQYGSMFWLVSFCFITFRLQFLSSPTHTSVHALFLYIGVALLASALVNVRLSLKRS
eukprot:m.144214 g.144214  ORF g.144214 m.144214 type:complete len:72 (+) comp10059_c0_seq1:3269-3484(+)